MCTEDFGMTDIKGIEETTNGRCEAGLMLAGAYFRCDLGVHHDGWPHSNREADSLWKEG